MPRVTWIPAGKCESVLERMSTNLVVSQALQDSDLIGRPFCQFEASPGQQLARFRSQTNSLLNRLCSSDKVVDAKALSQLRTTDGVRFAFVIRPLLKDA